MCLGGEMHDGVGFGDQPVHQIGVGDIALDQPDIVLDWRSDSRLPAYVSASSTVTASSGNPAHVLCTKFAPMKPAPPVTSNRMVKP